MKESFLLYLDQKEIFDKLTDEEAGKIIKAIFEYEFTKIEPELDRMLQFVFIPIKQNLDRNDDKWEDIKQKRSEAGKKSAETRKQQKVTNLTNVDFVKNETTNSTVNVNDNVNVNVNVNDNVNDINNKKNTKKSSPKKIIPKIDFAEFVKMTNAEYEKLVSTHGKEFTDQCIEVLDNYKGANGKKYQSDYRAILNWVIDRVKEDNAKKGVKDGRKNSEYSGLDLSKVLYKPTEKQTIDESELI